MSQKHIQRKGGVRRWRTSLPASGLPGFPVFFAWSFWSLSRRKGHAGAGQRQLLAPHVEQTIREREEELIFREQFRARLRPVSVDRPPSAPPVSHPNAAQLPIIRSSAALDFPDAPASPRTSDTSGQGSPASSSPSSSHSAFTAAVMARISSPAIGQEGSQGCAASGAPPEASPAMSFAFGAAPGGRHVSYAMVAQHMRALFGIYGLAALIVLLSGALFSFFAPTLVFSGLNMLLNALIVVFTATGQVWRVLVGVVGGLGILYLALTLLIAPFLLFAVQARAGSAYTKA